MKERFFTKLDWAAFWTATVATFAVYFLTLGPSVGLEDSGELATAAANLGVPHPPGYPFWTFCSWLFCKLFGWVTYMGHPTPAWCVSLCSAVFGAFAAGCTAMLICRSARDFIGGPAGADGEKASRGADILGFGGGVAGAITFSLSPVEWSQSTIVEIYSLNALFLMLVFLLSYRWMRRPTDRMLWATAFVFGLGLTNYQVLLFAIVPLAIIIALRNIAMFRDFALYLIPVALCYQIFQVGDLNRAQAWMHSDVIEKHPPVGMTLKEYSETLAVNAYPEQFLMCVTKPEKWQRQMRQLENNYILASEANDKERFEQVKNALALAQAIEKETEKLSMRGKNGEKPVVYEDLQKGKIHQIVGRTDRNPSQAGVIVSFTVFIGAMLLAIFFRGRGRSAEAVRTLVYGGGAGVVGLILSGTLFASHEEWSELTLATAPLVEPFIYIAVAVCIALSVLAAVLATIEAPERVFAKFTRRNLLTAAGVFAAAAVLVVLVFVPQAEIVNILSDTYRGEQYPWGGLFGTVAKFCYLIIALFALAWFVPNGLAYAIPVAGLQIAAFLLLKRGAMNGVTHPASWWFWWMAVWNFVVLALVWHVLPYGRSVAGAAFFTQLGVSFYAYMPIVSDLRNPPMNWGYPRTWDGFKHAVSRGQYEEIKMLKFTGEELLRGEWRSAVAEYRSGGLSWFVGFLASVQEFIGFFGRQMAHYFQDVKVQFTDALVWFALVPFALLATLPAVFVRSFRRLFAFDGRAGRGEYWFLATSTLIVTCLVTALVSAAGASSAVVWAVFILLFNLRAWLMTAVVSRRLNDLGWDHRLSAVHAVVAFSTLAFALAAKQLCMATAAVALLAGLVALVAEIAVAGFWPGKPEATEAGPVPEIDTASPQYRLCRFLASERLVGDHVAFLQWMLAALSCFLMMSFVLLLLANVKGDLQDGFIQKVKFISSHAMIALWIGYGLFIVGNLIAKALGRLTGAVRLWATLLAAVTIAVAIAFPIYDNYCGDYVLGTNEVAWKLGGSEQNGHTFGWQFGAYQLEGANAIREQLTADEEPLPDPTYPPPMDRYSIFFGGTDPGRFVPTYMIYSADFRPDVYLITQNALADDTYMSVERDLYGDEIWIPSKEDSSAAFDRYIREAQADPVRYQTLLANGTLSLANGRVQVTGALAVMDINAILTEMMHSHDRYRHSFYVEESYVIQWMYPYLEPHGLIMKINAEKKPLDAGRIAQDRDFWDWYVRRLLDDPMYRRDFAGQKSFSKLRTSIAGLYSSGQRRRDEAQAFREAVVLYPASPEATFRYAQECLLQSWSTYDYDKVLEMMEYTDRIDPGNSRTKGLSERVKTLRTAMVDYQRYTAMRREQRTPTAEESLRFAESAVMLGRYGEARQLLQESKDRLSVPATLFAATELLIRIGDYELAESYLIDFANRYPLYGENGVIVMVQLARIQMRMGRSKDAENSLARAIRFDRKRTKALIGGDGALMKLYEVLSAPQKTPSASWASPQFGR